MTLLSQFHFKGRQEQAATDPNHAIAVTAGAGSGKTLSLVGRYLHLLEQGYPLRSILAITFTEKAAREMRSRIRSALSQPSTDSSSFILHPLAPDRGSNLDSARIGTIHSLCAEILRSHPAEAGLDPAFNVLEEGLSAALQAESINSALAWAASDEQSAALFEPFSESDLRQILKTLLGRRLDIYSLLPLGRVPDRVEGLGMRKQFSSALASYLATHLDSLAWLNNLTDLAAHQSVAPDDKLELARRAVLACWDEVQAARAAQSWDAVLANLAELRKASFTQGKKDNWNASSLETVRAAMSELRQIYDEQLKFLAEKARFALDEQVAAHLPAIHGLIDQTVSEYQRRKDERQSLDFDDLEGLTAQLLTAHPEVCAELQSELRAVLVDEFQDTNDRQRQIVYALTRFSPSPVGVVPTGNGRGGSVDLFLVGDAKQSIYKFRNADVTIFRRVQDDVQASGGLTLDLDLTFRAHKSLLETLNNLLAPILGETNDPVRPYAVPFAPLRAYRQAPVRESIQPPYVEFHLGLGESAETGRLAAATALARCLRQLHETEGFAWGDMALLFRSSTAYVAYENALEAENIPFVTVAGRGFYDRPEIRDLLNALAAIADPTDNLSLAGLLRSPAFAIPDAEIYRLCFSPLPAGEGQGMRDALRGSMNSSHQRAYSILTELQSIAGRAPAAAVLKRFLDLTGYRAILASVPNGGRMLRNVEKLLADAHRSRLVSLTDFLAYVQTLRDVGLREGEAPADLASSGAVQLMTIHKAKGLEFPLTVLADAAYEHRGAGGKVQIQDGLLLDLKDGDFHPTAWQLAARLEEDRDDAEDRRLLYVAATRAKEKLLISAHVKPKRDGALSLTGWLNYFGLDQIQISGGMSQPKVIPLNVAGCSLTLYPASVVEADFPQLVSVSQPEFPRKSDLLEPIIPIPPITDEKTRAREADPPQRVWRIVPVAKRPHAPAWLVGKLVHESLHRWRFPAEGQRGFPDAEFETFLRPLAIEAGLTDSTEIHAAVLEVRRLLERFRAHPLFAELDAAERHHEIPYFLPNDRGVIDLLYRTEAGWFIIDFKTDEVRSNEEAQVVIRENEYDKQLARYARAFTGQVQARAKARLVFLNVDKNLAIFDLQEKP
jgi:ATP-dependent helicase/nuclease subunit A